ncbi:hypothetical protein DFH06DRAFT_1139069 [Mycena polygramma]|nr:hypothetical protein DFH06DRAFT_1139069 [Mycena polygramma]
MHAAEHNPIPFLITYDYTCLIACDANFRARRRVLHGEDDPRLHSAATRIQLMILRTLRGPRQLERAWNALCEAKRSRGHQTICRACPRQEADLAERFEEVDTEEAEGV